MIAFGVSDGHWSWERFSFQLYRSWTTDSMMNLHGSIKMLTVGKAMRDPSALQTLLYPLYLVGRSLVSWPWLTLWVWAHLDESKAIYHHSKRPVPLPSACEGLEAYGTVQSTHIPGCLRISALHHLHQSLPEKQNKTVLMGDNLEFIFIPRCYDCRTWIKPNQWTFPFLECMSSCSWNYIHWFHFIIVQEKQEFMERSQWCCLADTTRLERGPCRSLKC